MARIAGIDLPRNKRIEIALTYIHGIGRGSAVAICEKAEIDGDSKTETLSDGEVVLGSPAFDANKAKRAYLLLRSLPEMHKSLRKLEERLSDLEKGGKP